MSGVLVKHLVLKRMLPLVPSPLGQEGGYGHTRCDREEELMVKPKYTWVSDCQTAKSLWKRATPCSREARYRKEAAPRVKSP